MASSQYCSNSPPKSIRFFKIVLTEIGSHTKLMIPRKFDKIFGNKLDIRIQLSAPGGSVWFIDLVKYQDKVWLKNGWPEFAKFYSIGFGYLLVFEYLGDSKFQVLIFDQSASEIDYQSTCSANLNFVKSTQLENTENEINTTISDVIRPRKKIKATSASIEPCNHGQKLVEEEANVNGKSACNLEKNNALVSAMAFNSKNPYFIVSLKPSHVEGCSGLHIAKTYEKVYIKWMNNVEVIFEVGGNTWPVYSRLNLIYKRCTLTKGWRFFARDNSLKVGDVCVFELINTSKKLFKVHISSNMRG